MGGGAVVLLWVKYMYCPLSKQLNVKQVVILIPEMFGSAGQSHCLITGDTVPQTELEEEEGTEGRGGLYCPCLRTNKAAIQYTKQS